MRKQVLISGGTGLIGSRLTEMLVAENYAVIVLTRNPEKYAASAHVRYAGWDINAGHIDAWAINEADVIVHLAGAGVVDKPWTDQYKKEILDSRTKSAALLVQAVNTIPNNVETVVSQSAIGYYNETGTSYASKESDAPASGFLGETCVAWENSMRPMQAAGKRLVYIRTGIVLSMKGGAMKEFLKPLQFHVAAVLGSGKQMVSWIHIDDLCRMFIYAIANKNLSNVYNGVAPAPVSNKVLNIALGKAMHGSSFITMKVPSFVLRLMMGERSMEVLKSANVSAEKILSEGFYFKYKTIAGAAGELLKGESANGS